MLTAVTRIGSRRNRDVLEGLVTGLPDIEDTLLDVLAVAQCIISTADDLSTYFGPRVLYVDLAGRRRRRRR